MAGRTKKPARPRSPHFADCVFVNCPFDAEYWPVFEAIQHAVRARLGSRCPLVRCSAAPHHANSPTNAIKAVRDWLQGASDRKTLPGPAAINARFASFSAALPELATAAGLDRHQLSFIDYVNLAEGWLRFGV